MTTDLLEKALYILVAISVVGALALLVALGIKELAPKPIPAQTHDSLDVTYTYDGEAIRWYVFTDPDTGVEYLVNDKGGCVERQHQ